MNPSPVTFARFTLLSELGRGTTGIVYKAHDRQLNNRVVALKLLLPGTGSEWVTRCTQFLHEAQAWASFKHEHIVALFEMGECDGCPYCVREFVDGSTLETLVAEKLIDPRTGLRLLSQVCEAVGAVHQANIAHRNLIPSNVLVASISETWRAKLLGFLGERAGLPNRTSETWRAKLLGFSRALRAKLIGFGRVIRLTESPSRPDGPTEADLRRLAGQLKAADTQALHRMLRWLADALEQPLPAELAALDAPTPAALADALRRYV